MGIDLTQYEARSIACQRLGVRSQTLYAYVSRGLLRVTRHPNDSRKSLYLSVDVDRLLNRKTRGRSRAAIAASTIDCGEPILSSALTQIKNGRFYYRGQEACKYSRNATLEQVFCLLCEVSDRQIDSRVITSSPSSRRNPYARMLELLSNEALSTPQRTSKRYAYTLLCRVVAAAVGKPYDSSTPIHEFLAQHWSDQQHAADLIRRALVLCADHELNASAYAARVAASAGSSLAASTLVGLATLSGTRHGGLTDQCVTWMRKMASDPEALTAYMQNGSTTTPPGFGQPLYPRGDPRATELLRTRQMNANWQAVLQQVQLKTAQFPALDFGLAVVENELGMPRGTGFGIFAVGRTVGWMAHSFEQRKSSVVIRPRALPAKT